MPRGDQTSRAQRLERAIGAMDQMSQHVEGLDRAAFLTSPLHQDAVAMRFQQVADILRSFDDPEGEFRERLPNAGEIIGMRNYIAHQYHAVQMELLWTAATELAPQLRARLQLFLDETNSSG